MIYARAMNAPDGHAKGMVLPRLAVVAVAGQRSADGDDVPGVGVDDDLAVMEYWSFFDGSAVGRSVP